MSQITQRPEFINFRAQIAKKRATVGRNHTDWTYYDVGPKDSEPLIMLHGTSGTADIFFYQLMSLGHRGYRLISVQIPPFSSVESFVDGLKQFVDHLELPKIHLFGASLGGFLACHFVARYTEMVRSLVLCNAFIDTEPFQQSSGCLSMFKYMPEFVLKKYVLDSFPEMTMNPEVIDFCVDQLESLTRKDIAARLTLNCTLSRVREFKDFPDSRITIMDTFDEVVLPDSMRERLYKRFSEAKMATIKSGGDFPMLSTPEDVNMHLIVHMRNHAEPEEDTPAAAGTKDDSVAHEQPSAFFPLRSKPPPPKTEPPPKKAPEEISYEESKNIMEQVLEKTEIVGDVGEAELAERKRQELEEEEHRRRDEENSVIEAEKAKKTTAILAKLVEEDPQEIVTAFVEDIPKATRDSD